MNRYPNKPPKASDGEDFARLCCELWLRFYGETLTPCRTREAQLEFGDTYEGHEFKHLRNAVNRLHIEIAERTSVDRPWVARGIYGPSRWYMCGNGLDVYLFAKSALIEWREREEPREVTYGWNPLTGVMVKNDPDWATIRSYVLAKSDADEFCTNRFLNGRDGWIAAKDTGALIWHRCLECGLQGWAAMGGSYCRVHAQKVIEAVR
jgi:hypothetical protein